MTEVEEMFKSPLATKVRDLNQRLKVAIQEEEPLENCPCCNMPASHCSCNGGCE